MNAVNERPSHDAKLNRELNPTIRAGEIKPALTAQPDFLVPVVQEAVQAMLEVEMEECLQAGKHERNDQRLGYRSGYYRRRLITRVGTLVLRVPQDRAGHFSTQVFEQYQRSEKALLTAIRAELCGYEFSASSFSAITARLDAQLEEFSRRPLTEAFPHVILDARYERVREGGVIASLAVLGPRRAGALRHPGRHGASAFAKQVLPSRGKVCEGQFV